MCIRTGSYLVPCPSAYIAKSIAVAPISVRKLNAVTLTHTFSNGTMTRPLNCGMSKLAFSLQIRLFSVAQTF